MSRDSWFARNRTVVIVVTLVVIAAGAAAGWYYMDMKAKEAAKEEMREYVGTVQEIVARVGQAAQTMNMNILDWPNVSEEQLSVITQAAETMGEALVDAQAVKAPEGWEAHYTPFIEGVQGYADSSIIFVETASSGDEDALVEAATGFRDAAAKFETAAELMTDLRRENRVF